MSAPFTTLSPLYAPRPARPSDAPVIVRWFRDRAEVVRWAGETPPEPLTAGWLARDLAHPLRRHHVLLGPEGAVAGVFSVVFHRAERRAHLIRFALDPALRGRGLGARLIEAAVEVARSQGAAEHLTLQVFADNAPARRTYARAGFRAYARTGGPPAGETEVVRMVLPLD